MLKGNFFRGLGYLGEGFRLIRQPGLRLFVVIPLVINILLFGLLFYFLAELFAAMIATAMSWLPDWAWAYDYPNNVHGIILDNPVWPTPVYEITMAFIIFAILWSIRKQFAPGVRFCIYFIFAGIERFSIESIRVNPDQFKGVAFTQAEIISMAMMLIGILGIFYFNKVHKSKTP